MVRRRILWVRGCQGTPMSLSQPSDSPPGDVWSDPGALRWIGWGLALAGLVATVMRLFQPGPLWSGVLLAAAVLGLVVIMRAPEAFETRWRSGGRGLNPMVGAPAILLFFIALTDQVDDL